MVIEFCTTVTSIVLADEMKFVGNGTFLHCIKVKLLRFLFLFLTVLVLQQFTVSQTMQIVKFTKINTEENWYLKTWNQKSVNCLLHKCKFM